LNELTPVQLQLYKDKHRFIVLTSGRRSKKTLISKRKLLKEALREPSKYFHGTPTHKQAKNIFWADLKRDTKLFRSKPPNETDRFVTLHNGSEIHVMGLDKPERIEGQVWHGCHISEIANIKPGAWEANIRPVLSDTGGWAI